MPSFPSYRPRRLRRTDALRRLVRETVLQPSQLVLPLFVRAGRGVRMPVESMPGVDQTSVDELLNDATEAASLGVGGVMLFGIPDTKDATGSEAWNDDAPVQQAVRALKREVPELVVITDVCLCEYTEHGHCGVLRDGDVDNDATLELLAREAVSHARAGADIVAPSDMMDGRVGAIRAALDEAGFANTAILELRGEVRRRRSTVRSARRPSRRRSSATGAAIRWTSANSDEALREVMARHRGRRRHGDGEAGRTVPRHHSSREDRDRLSASPRTR